MSQEAQVDSPAVEVEFEQALDGPDALPRPDPGNPPVSRFEEYKFFIANTNDLTGRRLAANSFFHGFNGAVLVVIGTLFVRVTFDNWTILAMVAPLSIISIASSIMWRQTITNYRRLIGWRFEQIQKMEQSPEMAGSYQMYTREWEELFKPDAGKKTFGFSNLEMQLPILMDGIEAAE